MKHKGRSLLILFLLLLEVYGKLLSTKTSSKKSWRNQEYQPVIKDEEEETLGAYAEMATYLKRYGQKNGFKDYSLDEIENTLSSLATAQATWKSMDGLTHQLKNTFKKSSSLQSRYENFIDKKKKNTKEAAKLREYVTTVERGMQACEILQTVSINDPMERKESLLQANLTEISRFPLHYNKLHCTVSFLLPIPDNTENNTDYSQISPELQAYGRDELVIAITDDVKKASISIAQLLRLMSFESPVPITIPSQDEPFFIQPTLLELSLKVCEHLSSFLSRVKASNTQSTSDGDTAEHLIDQLNDITHQKSTLIKRPPKRFRVIGYSAGGGVASYFSMILDGALDIKSYFQAKSASSSSSTTTDSLTNTTSNSFNETSSVKEEIDDVSSLFGKYRNRIRTMVIGPPPCISRNIVPKFISCIIHGDDVISRTQTSSISQFQQRMKKALKGGAGKASSWGWMLNTGLLQDVKTVAGKSLSRYKVAKKDAKNINLPGRVFFIKSRKYKQGATIQRVLRGNWQEDILWNLHDILISEKMFQHHSIESFIKTLARC